MKSTKKRNHSEYTLPENLFSVFLQKLSPHRRFLYGGAALLFWIAVWWGVSLLIRQEILLPTPLQVAKVWGKLAKTASFWITAGLSLFRVTVGFIVGTLLGVLSAFLTHYLMAVRVLLTPFIRILRAVPVASFIILALVWVQTEVLPSFIAAAMALPMVWQNVSGALENDIDGKLLEMATVYHLPKRTVFYKIVLPSVFPAFVTGAVGALGFAWKSGIAAEVICQPAMSIGKQLQSAKLYLETPQVFAWTVTVCILSMTLENVLKRLAARFGKRKSREGGQ